MNKNMIWFIVSAMFGAAIGAYLTYRETKNTITELVSEADEILERLDKYVEYVEREKIASIKEEMNKQFGIIGVDLNREDGDFKAEYWIRSDEHTTGSKPADHGYYENNGIVRVSEEEILENPMYERVSLVYYAQNGGVYESVGNYRVLDPESSIGDAFEEIFKNEEDTEVLYFRNHDQGIDYEVILDYNDPPEEE